MDLACAYVVLCMCAYMQKLGFGVLYFNTFLVLGSHYSYLYLKSIYFFLGSTPEVGKSLLTRQKKF